MRTFKNMYLILAAFLFALMLRNPVMVAGSDSVEQVKPVIGKITAMLIEIGRASCRERV